MPQPCHAALTYFRIFVRKLLALAATVWTFHRFAADLPRPLLLFLEGERRDGTVGATGLRRLHQGLVAGPKSHMR